MSDCFVLYLLLTCMKKKTSGADKFTNNIFAGKRKGCIMGAVPGDCAWYFYKRLMGHSDAFRPVEEIQKQYRESVRKKSDAGKQLEKGMEMLLVTAEMKYGAKYAAELREKGYV